MKLFLASHLVLCLPNLALCCLRLHDQGVVNRQHKPSQECGSEYDKQGAAKASVGFAVFRHAMFSNCARRGVPGSGSLARQQNGESDGLFQAVVRHEPSVHVAIHRFQWNLASSIASSTASGATFCWSSSTSEGRAISRWSAIAATISTNLVISCSASRLT